MIRSFLIVLVLGIVPAVAVGFLLATLWTRIRRRLRRGAASGNGVFESRTLTRLAAGVTGLYGLVGLYSFLVEPDWIAVERTTILADPPLLGKPGFRIVHLSDLHLEAFGSRERSILRRIAEERPDAIILTGDYVNAREAVPALEKFLRALSAPAGVYGVEGHADRKFPIERAFDAAGAMLLRDEFVLKTDGSDRPLAIAGLAHPPGRPLREVLEAAPPEAYRIVLHHAPGEARALRETRADLFLCGHTHGGQICLPLLGPVLPVWDAEEGMLRGEFERRGTTIIVNRGLGMSGGLLPRARFLSRPEIRVIDILGTGR